MMNFPTGNKLDPNRLMELAACYDHFSGFAAWKDLDQSYLFMSNATAKSVGFKNSRQTIGAKIKDYDLKCPISTLSDCFIEEDLTVIKTRSRLRLLAYGCYLDDNWRILLGEKFPIFDHGNLIAVGCFYTDVSQSPLAAYVFNQFSRDHASEYTIKKQRQLVYQIDSQAHQAIPLTKRQMECLYYALRGYSLSAIATKLAISIRTVETHTSIMKEKFHVKSKSELIEKAIYLGYLQIIPESIINQTIPS